MSNLVTPEAKGAFGNDTADDTTAMQAAFDDGRTVMLKSGAVYRVNNLTIPARTGFAIIGNGATIKKISSGDNHYLCASDNYLNNTNSSQAPCRIDGVVFDGNDISEYALVIQNYNSDITVECLQATKSGMLVTAETRNGTALSGTLVDSRIHLRSHDNGECGLFVQDSNRNKATDGTLLPGSTFYNNVAYAVLIDAGAGWHIGGIRTYNNGGGVRFDGASEGTRVQDSYIDDGAGALGVALPTGETFSCAIEVNALLSHGLLKVSNNVLAGPVRSLGAGDTAPYGVWSEGNQYTTSNGYLRHEVNDTTRISYSVGDSFEVATPFVWHSGSSVGKIVAKDSRRQSDNTWLDGDFDGANPPA